MATKRSDRVTTKVGRKWAMREHARNIHVITIKLDRVGDSQACLLQSDVHWDNPHCKQDLFYQHLDEALARDAPVLDNGDFYCAMQGKWDKRANKNDLRPEHQRADYLDALVSTAAEKLKPYRSVLTVRGQGNHETSVARHHETNLCERLTERIKAYGNTPVALGGYSGYVVFVVELHNGTRVPFKMHYLHGHGGGGAVTRGVIQTNRHAVYLADADIIWTGHSHDAWQVPIARVRLNQDNTKIVHSNQYHLSTPGYKEEWQDGYEGWHVERGAPPKPTGAAWLTFKYASTAHATFEITEAK
ncbi:MAG: hypothetical protein NUW22_04895 [Acidobacteria bacterium]|nr:hypothetical protein [Acidobacteriota bacterium]